MECELIKTNRGGFKLCATCYMHSKYRKVKDRTCCCCDLSKHSIQQCTASAKSDETHDLKEATNNHVRIEASISDFIPKDLEKGYLNLWGLCPLLRC